MKSDHQMWCTVFRGSVMFGGMQNPLEGVWAKVERASEHIDTLRLELRTFLGPDALVANLRDNDGSESTAAFAKEHEERVVPVRLRILAGESIHQVRSSLDHLLCVLVRDNGKEPTKRNQFPILDVKPHDTDTRRAWRLQVAGLSDDAVDFIESVQPYRCSEPSKDPLWILKTLNDEDKHQSVLLNVPKAVPMLHMTMPDGWKGEQSDDGEAVINIDGFTIERKLAAHIVFPTFGADLNVPVIKGLETFYWHVGISVIRAAKLRLLPMAPP